MSLDGQVVLITGGTGSFGRKFIELALKEHSPKRLIVFSRDELKQHEMRAAGFDDPVMRYFIGDVRDRDRLVRAFHDVDVVVHAAALKQVVACEYNPIEAILTNIMGTRNVIDACIDAGVGKAIHIGTDKAVNPANLYGASKLCAEKLFVQGNAYASGTRTRFSGVRYGNVVGSRGSVVPVLREQRKCGRITITDERMTRFWITLEQGVRFVMHCIDETQGGEIFVPKIPSMGLREIAAAIAPDCDVEVIGIRAGEKLHEVLVSEDEARHTVELDEMYVVQPTHPWWDGAVPSVGTALPDGFRYTSDTNPKWLTADDLETLLDGLG